MDDTVTKNASKAATHAVKAAEASVEPIKEALVVAGKAKWITPKNIAIAAGVVVVTGATVVVVKKVKALKAATQVETED